MRRLTRLLAALAVVLLVLTVFAGPALASARVSASMSGANEVPPNASAATGSFSARVVPYKGKLCYSFVYQGLSSPAAGAHIHQADPGVAGPMIVPLILAPSTVTQCVSGLDHSVLRQIARHPTRFYVDIHSQTFPNGEIRGQLAKA